MGIFDRFKRFFGKGSSEAPLAQEKEEKEEVKRPPTLHVCFNRSEIITRRVKRPGHPKTEFYNDDGDLIQD